MEPSPLSGLMYDLTVYGTLNADRKLMCSGGRLYSLNSSGSLNVCDTSSTLRKTHTFTAAGNTFFSYGSTLVYEKEHDDNQLTLFDINDRSKLSKMQGHSDTILSMAGNEDYVVSGSLDKTVKVWEIQSRSMKRSFSIGSPAQEVRIRGDKVYVCAQKTEKLLSSWSVETGNLAQVFDTQRNTVTCLGPYDGHSLVGGTDGGRLIFWDERQPRQIGMSSDGCSSEVVKYGPRSNVHTSSITCCKVVDEHCLVTGSKDCTVKVWDLRNREVAAKNAPTMSGVCSIGLENRGVEGFRMYVGRERFGTLTYNFKHLTHLTLFEWMGVISNVNNYFAEGQAKSIE